MRYGRIRPLGSCGRRADAVVLPAGLAVDPALTQKPIWRINRELVLPNLPAAPVVFCGIARPEQFFAQVRAAGIAPAKQVTFRDHHPYPKSDIDRLQAMRNKLGASGFLTTEKDAVNLGSLQVNLEPLAVAQLKLTLEDPTAVVNAILARIAKRKLRS